MKLDKVAWWNKFTLGVIDEKKKKKRNEDLVYIRKYISQSTAHYFSYVVIHIYINFTRD